MKTTDIEFKNRLDKLCKENWKAGRLIKINGCFEKLPEHQQKLFLKEMGIDSIDIINTVIV